MRTIEAGPDTLDEALRGATAGTIIKLEEGRYRALRIRNIRGDPSRPIVVEGGDDVFFDGGIELDRFRPRAARVARKTKQIGKYPGVYPIAHQARVRISNCAGLTFRNLRFHRSWPTAIHIEDSQHLALEDIRAVGSSYFSL